MIAAKNHANAVHNPYAHVRKAFDVEFCNTVSERNPLVAGPLRRTDCSMVSDGAAALVVADEQTAAPCVAPSASRARTHVNDFLPSSRRDPIAFEGRAAWPGQGPGRRPGVASTTWPSWRPTTASPSPR